MLRGLVWPCLARADADTFDSGSWVGYAFLAGPVNNRLGRRWTGFVGVAILCVGAALQAGAVDLAMMVVGRIIAGGGTSLVSTAVPLYLSEIAPAKTRGAFVAANQIGIVRSPAHSIARTRLTVSR